MFPRSGRLTTRQFEQVFQHGRLTKNQLLQLKSHRLNACDDPRWAVAAPRRCGRAHQRNRIRRRVREQLRTGPLSQPLRLDPRWQGCGSIVFASVGCATATPAQLDEAVADVLRRTLAKMPN